MRNKVLWLLTVVLISCSNAFGTATEGIFWISGSNVVMTGSIDVTGANTDVPGTGTAFTTELGIGASILVSGETRVIATITDDDTATVTVAWGSDLADDLTPEIVPYATLITFEADLGNLTGNLTVLHRDEETANGTDIMFDLDTGGFLLKITAEDGAEHNGTAYGNGARINYGAGDSIEFDEASAGTLDDIEFSNLALDISGSGTNEALRYDDGADNGIWTTNRVLITGGGTALWGLRIAGSCTNSVTRNGTFYSIGDAAGEGGLIIRNVGVGDNHIIENNTFAKCYNNMVQDGGSVGGTLTIQNNLCQDDQGGQDFANDGGGGFGTTTKNISEDATSPDVAGRSLNLHDGTSNFIDFPNDNYLMASGGDAIDTLKAGTDLTVQFTDDIIGNTRLAATFFIGSSWISVGAPAPTFIPQIMISQLMQRLTPGFEFLYN